MEGEDPYQRRGASCRCARQYREWLLKMLNYCCRTQRADARLIVLLPPLDEFLKRHCKARVAQFVLCDKQSG